MEIRLERSDHREAPAAAAVVRLQQDLEGR
jgi:hypothetical protein